MNDECPICLEYLDGVIVRLKCNHRYHQVCIEDWFNRTISSNNSLMCPECNLPGDISEIEYVNMKSQQVLEITLTQSIGDHTVINSDSESESDSEEIPTKKCNNFCIIN